MRWMRFDNQGSIGFGVLEGDRVRCYEGDMFGTAEATETFLAVTDLRWLPPCQPGKLRARQQTSRVGTGATASRRTRSDRAGKPSLL